MANRRVTFMRGISGSGKSTLARELAAKTGAVRVNMDNIRAMLGLPYSKDAERLALKVQDTTVLAALRAGKDVIVDNTHLHPTWAKRIATLIWESNVDVEYQIVSMNTPLDECLLRDASREASVGEAVIKKQHNALQSSRANWDVSSIMLPEIIPVEPYPTLPKACIIDIDGTLAKHVSRGPFDMEKCHEDEVFEHIAEMVDMHAERGYDIILCSGRADTWRDMTETWLSMNEIHFDLLLMRPAEDQRRDSIIKLNLFNEHIRGNYDVAFAMDDRNRVVDVWRALGIPCLQVAAGDF